ncbi:hypothetical protein EVJ58_g9529 [Rhodofomes roseus]|uniref:F-box domain-containing protein n=1 Tax=Rhodofomes roseus TaxID=34475 RepID=A0A4Y9XU40_9APHY|nr:hypothetical protein EVJ58_g9529 [Rhodofomes roseus]
MDLFTLNADVLTIILSLVDPYDAFQLSLTCRAAQAIAVPRFLEAVVFPLPWLCSPNARRSPLAYPELYECFRTYMFAHGSNRLRQLKSLTLAEDAFCIQYGSQHLEPPRYTFTLAAPLADVVRYAVELRKIRIDHSEAIFDAAPQLADAIANLPQLQEICFFGADVSTLELLSRTQSRPRKVELRIIEYSNTIETWWGQYVRGGNRFLSNFTESLEVLSLCGGLDIIEELEPGTVWPAVVELRLARGPTANLQAMSCAFPNLRRLHVECPPAAIVAPIDQWRALDFVLTTHPLPLQYPVRHLKMNWFSLGPYVPTPQHQALVDSTTVMLRNTQPIVLECSACKSTYSCIARNAPSVRFLRITGAPSRHHTEKERQLTNDRADALLTYDFSLLKALPLKGIAIVLQRHRPWREIAHWEQYAHVIATCIPTLEYVGLRQKAKAWAPVDQWDGPEPYVWYHVAERSGRNEPVVEHISASGWSRWTA